MPENIISSIHSVVPETGTSTIKQAVQPSQSHKEAVAGVSQKPPVGKNEAVHNQAEQHNEDVETPIQATQGQDIRLKFQVDAKTKAVTVFVLDKSSQQVIRTIPAGEMNKLKEGDLISLFT